MGRRTLRRGGAAGIIGVALALLVGSVAEANFGDLDTSFGNGGKQMLNLGGTDRATHVVLMTDGRLLVVGSTDARGGGDFAIARYTAAGAPDTSFNSSGHVTFGTSPGVNDIGGGVVVQADGRIVVSGFGGTSQDFITKRLNPNGTVDGTFAGGTGTSDIDFGGTETMSAMVAQPDGKLVLVGSTSAGGGDFAIVRLNADGTPDTTFSGDGKQTVDFGGADSATAVATQPDGQIVIAGQGGAGSDMAVARLTSTGSLDTSFGSGGKAFVDFGGTEAANGVALQPDGRVVLAGTTSQGSGDLAVARLSAAGAIDTTFSGDGKYAFGFGAAGEQGLALALQQNGRIVVMGTGDVDNDFVVARLEASGNPDTSFGTNGSVGVDFGGFEYDGDVAVQPDGQIVIAGSTNAHDGGDIALARLQGDPVPVTPPPTTTTTTTTTTAALGPGLPVPRFRIGTSLTLPGGTRFSGVDSTVAAGRRIINYHWQIELPKRKTFQTDCGSQSAISLSMRLPSLLTAKLTVTDSSGAQASTQQRFRPVHKLGVKPTGAFDCENPAKGNQPSRADCAKSFGTAFLDINSRGGPNDCFEIANVNPPSGAPYTTATVAGPVAINGLYVPVPKAVKTDYDSQNRVALHGLSHIELRFGTFVTKDIDLHFQATPKHGVFHLIDVSPEVNTPKFLGSLPISGSFSIDLIQHASRVHIGVGLPSPFSFGAKKTAQAKLYVYSNNRQGLRYDGISATIPALWLGPIYVENLHFAYEKSTNSWEGAAKVTLPGSRIALNAAPPPPDFGFKIVRGKFSSAGFGINFQPPTQPDLFPPFHTVLLSHIGGAVGLNPFRITGTIGISAANIVDEDGVLLAVFATGRQPYTLPDDPGPELAPLAGRTFDRFSLAIGGNATSVKVPILGALPLLHAYGLYEFPDYFEFGGGFSFKVGPVSLDGNVSGFVYPSSRKFNAEAGLKACLTKVRIGYKFVKITVSPCLSVGAVVSSRGIGFCGVVGVPFPIFGHIPVNIGAGYHWGDSLPKLMIFSCDYSGYRERSPFAAHDAATGYRVRLPRGLPAEMFRVRGRSGTPALVITDPHGQDITKSGDAITVEDTEPNTVLVGLRHPAAGNWTIAAAAGSVPIAAVASADGLPDPGVRARITGAGHRRVLHYRYTPVTGRKVTFVERGRDSSRVLGSAHARAGTIAFTPGPGRGKHTVIAQISQDGTPARDLEVATYTAPGPVAPARPGHVRTTRRRGTIRVSWRAVTGARLYEVLVQLTDGSRQFRVVSRARVTIPDPLPSRRGTVSVDALSIDSVRGRATTVRLAPVPARRR